MNGQTAARPRSRLRRMSASLIGAASVLWLSGISWMPIAAASSALDNLDGQIEQPLPLPQTPSVEPSDSSVSVETITESENSVSPADAIPWNRLEQVLLQPSETNLFTPLTKAEPTTESALEAEAPQSARSSPLRRMHLLHEPGAPGNHSPARKRSVTNSADVSDANRNRDLPPETTGETGDANRAFGLGLDPSQNLSQIPQPVGVEPVTNPIADSVTNVSENPQPVVTEPVTAIATTERPVPSNRPLPPDSSSPPPAVPVERAAPFWQVPPIRSDLAAVAAPVAIRRPSTRSTPTIPSGYVEMSNGVYVPEAFMHYDLQFRQAREARLQAWEAYQAAMYEQSAMIAALLPSELWQTDSSANPYLDQVAFLSSSVPAFRLPSPATDLLAARSTPTYSGMVNALSVVSTFATDTFPLYPLPSPVEMTSPHGWRAHPISGEQAFHQGVDLGAPAGTPVLATLSGVVESSGWNGGYGNTVTVRHFNGNLQTLYAHLSQAYVEPGEAVKQGQIIGTVGSTGNSTGPHLHYEMNQAAPQGWESIDNTDLVTFAQQLLERQQYLQHYSQYLQANGQPTPFAYSSNSQLHPVSSPSSSSTSNTANEIRVGIEIDVNSFTVGSTAPLTITDTNNQPIASITGGVSYPVTRSANGGITIGGQSYDTTAIFVQPASPDALVAIDGRSYRGRLLIGARPQGGVSAINWVDQEQYLYSVVGSEVYPSWDPEALRAQAVAARSYSTYYRYNPVSPDWYDIGDDTYYQAYSGSAREYSTTTQAVNDTRGQVLMQGNAVLQAMYASTRELSIQAHNGIGMAQWGAADKAAAGWSYTAILSHYYPGAQLAVMN